VWLWGTFLAATIAYLLFMGPTEVLLPFFVKNRWGGHARDLGLIFALGGVGALGGAAAVGHWGVPGRSMVAMYGCWAAATFAVAGYGVATAAWQAMVVSFVFNALETTGTIIWVTTKQRLVPAELLGRVSSLDWFISLALLPVSFALTGVATAAIGARATLVAAGLIGGGVTMAFLFLPGIRTLDSASPDTAPVREQDR
jgi:hypothetical protein